MLYVIMLLYNIAFGNLKRSINYKHLKFMDYAQLEIWEVPADLQALGGLLATRHSKLQRQSLREHRLIH